MTWFHSTRTLSSGGFWTETNMALNLKLKRYQRDQEHSYSFGVYPTIELISHQPTAVLAVLLHSSGSSNQGVAKLRRYCEDLQIEIIENDRLVEKLAQRGNTYAVGVFRKYSENLDHQQNHIVLVNPSSMGNLGTILRTMLAFDFQDLAIIDPGVDHFDPKVIRASMGALFQCRISRIATFPDYWGRFRDHQLFPLMTDGKISLLEAGFQTPFSLIFGPESSGLSAEFSEYGTSVRIPIDDAVDSLNLATAAGITMYQSSLAQR